MLVFTLIDKTRNLYISRDKIEREPEFSPSYCAKEKDGWFFDQANEVWYKYEKRLKAILAIHPDGGKEFVDHMGIIQFSNKTIY